VLEKREVPSPVENRTSISQQISLLTELSVSSIILTVWSFDREKRERNKEKKEGNRERKYILLLFTATNFSSYSKKSRLVLRLVSVETKRWQSGKHYDKYKNQLDNAF
jgi:hypothetical protein